MATKNDKYSFTEQNFTTSENQYYNLNLNKSKKCAKLIPVQSYSKPNNDKYSGFNNDEVRTAVTSFIVSDNFEENIKLQSWQKFSKSSTLNGDKDGLKKEWKDGNTLNSTRSLHITAYKNPTASDLFDNENIEELKKGTFGSASKQGFTGAFKSQNPFEFPRQQNENQKTEPEVAQFKASQKLLDSKQPSQQTGHNDGQIVQPQTPPGAGTALDVSKKDPKPATPTTKKDDATKSSKEKKSTKETGKSKIVDAAAKSTKSKKETTSKKEPEKKLQLKDLIRKHLLAGSVRMEYELWELHQLLDMAKISMQKKSTLIDVRTPVNICGDIHHVDCHSNLDISFWEIMLIVDDILWKVYGFHAELRTRYRSVLDSKQLYDHFNEIFSEMPLAAIVEGKILCMHGGLSPELNHLDDIRKIKRPLMIVRGLAQDLLWADPESGVKGFQPNKIRAVSHVFGEDAVQSKTKQLGIDMVIRAHQVVEFGYAFFANRQLVTVFSAARYHEDLCNFAAVVQVDDKLELAFMQLKPSEFDQQKKEKIVATMDCDEENDDDNPGADKNNNNSKEAGKTEGGGAPA